MPFKDAKVELKPGKNHTTHLFHPAWIKGI